MHFNRRFMYICMLSSLGVEKSEWLQCMVRNYKSTGIRSNFFRLYAGLFVEKDKSSSVREPCITVSTCNEQAVASNMVTLHSLFQIYTYIYL